MKNRIIKQAVLCCLAAFTAIIFLFACSKSGGGTGGTGGGGGGYGGGGGGGTTGNSVSIAGFAFSATSLSVAKGTKITWKNNDATTHTVTSDDGTFDSGNIAPGGSYSYTFADAGTFAYHCKIHPTMKAKVVVAQ